MATEQQKEELMQTLKFTPRDYRIEITGYGGELYYKYKYYQIRFQLNIFQPLYNSKRYYKI